MEREIAHDSLERGGRAAKSLVRRMSIRVGDPFVALLVEVGSGLGLRVRRWVQGFRHSWSCSTTSTADETPAMGDGSGLAEAMLGLDGVRVTSVIDGDAEVTIEVETTEPRAWCP